MKYLGQHIENFIAKFRQDVYLESVPNPGSDTDKFLVIDSDGKIGQRTGAEVASDIGVSGTFVDLTSEVTGVLPVANGGTGASSLTDNSILIGNGTSAITPSPNFTFDGDDLLLESANLQKPTFTLKNTNNSANPAIISFVKDKGAAGADDDIVGRIDFTSDNDAEEQHPYGNIACVVSENRDGNEEGKIVVNVCAFQSGSGAIDGNVITGEGNGNSIVDVTLGAGATSLTTIAGNLTVTSDLTVSGTTTTVNTSNLVVKDNNITLNYADGSDTSSSADGAGITIQDAVDASTNATILWTAASDTFTFSHPINATISTATQGTIDHDSLANFVAAEHYRWDNDISSTATINAANIPTLNQNTSGTAAGLSSTLAVGSGGTGATSLTDNAVLLGNGSSAIEASSHLSYYNPSTNLDYLRIGDDSTTTSGIISDNAAPLSIQVDANTGTNAAGSDMTFIAGTSTGNALGGSFIFRSSPSVGSSGTSVNVPAEIAVLSQSGNLQLDGGITTGSTSFVNSSGVIQTAAQTNITSVGTLTGLTTSGDVTIGGDLTVTSGTSGDATLIIEADTDNNNENDLPRLWFKADTITEGAIQLQNNTLDIINNVSSSNGIRFLTGTTNNTGTTDPSTGATERMFIASDGTVTVAGALQPNTIELGHASDTTIARSAAGKVTIEGANVQTSQICCTHHNMSLDGGSSTVDYYFPINSLSDGSSSGLYYTRVVAAYDGKIVKILFRGNSLPEGSSSNSFGTNSVIYMSRRDHDGSTYYHQTSGFQASETFNGSSQSTVIVPCGVGGANASDWVFSEGDVLGFSLVKNTTATDIDLAVTIVWEYTV